MPPSAAALPKKELKELDPYENDYVTNIVGGEHHSVAVYELKPNTDGGMTARKVFSAAALSASTDASASEDDVNARRKSEEIFAKESEGRGFGGIIAGLTFFEGTLDARAVRSIARRPPALTLEQRKAAANILDPTSPRFDDGGGRIEKRASTAAPAKPMNMMGDKLESSGEGGGRDRKLYGILH